jgi:hypothetical protein
MYQTNSNTEILFVQDSDTGQLFLYRDIVWYQGILQG